MAVETPISVTIGGANVGGSVLSLGTEQDICRVAQTCTIALDPNVATNFNPWDEIAISINGVGRFKGYVDEPLRGRKPAEYIVRGTDVMKRALDNYYAEITEDEAGLWWPNPFVVEQELDAGYWVDYWLNYVGITTSGPVETGRTVPVDLEWNFITVSDIILECLSYAGGGWTVIVDGDGVAQISKKVMGVASHSLSGTIGFSRSQEDSWRRDRAVVFGDGVVGEKPDDPAGCTKTAALSSTFIGTQAVADDLAQDILDFFDEDLDIKRCLIAGDASIWLGESAAVSDPWAGYSGTGLITSIETTVDDRGFRQLVSLDEKCGFIWGWGGENMYLMSDDKGVWAGNIDGLSWARMNEGLDGDDYDDNLAAMLIDPRKRYLWIAFRGGPWVTSGLSKRELTTSGSWQSVSLPEPTNEAGDGEPFTSADLRTRGFAMGADGRVYWLAYAWRTYGTDERTWLYTSDTSGTNWTCRQVNQANLGYLFRPTKENESVKNLAVTSGGTVFIAGRFQHPGSLFVNGSGYAQVPYGSSGSIMNLNIAFTLAWSMKPTEAEQSCVLMSRPDSYEVGLDSGRIYAKVWKEGGGEHIYSPGIFPDVPVDSWTAFKLRVDNSGEFGYAEFWLWRPDGGYLHPWGLLSPYTPQATSSDLYIGSRDGGTGHYKGYIDLVQHVNRWDYWAGFPSSVYERKVFTSQVFGYGLDELEGTTIFDDKGPCQLHGEIYGDAEFSDDHPEEFVGIEKHIVLQQVDASFNRVKLWLRSRPAFQLSIGVDIDDNLYAYGRGSDWNIEKSPDNGVNWAILPLEAGSYVHTLLPSLTTSGSLIAISRTREVYESLDGGGSWQEKAAVPKQNVNCGARVGDSHILVGIYSSDAIYASIDDCESWAHLDLDGLIRDDIYDIAIGF